MNDARIAGVFAAFVLSACASSMEEYEDFLPTIQSCTSGESCVVAGGDTSCTCPVPVNASKVDELESFEEDMTCNAMILHCRNVTSASCKDGRCIGD